MKQIDRNFYEAAKMMADIDANHYPERMGVTLIVNAPRSFSAVWAVVRPWLDEQTASKIQIVSGDYRLQVLKLADESQLPAQHHGIANESSDLSPQSLSPANGFEPPIALLEWLGSDEARMARCVSMAWNEALTVKRHPGAAAEALIPLRQASISDRWNYLNNLHEVWSDASGTVTVAARLRSRGLVALADAVLQGADQNDVMAAADALCELGSRNLATDLWRAAHTKLPQGGVAGESLMLTRI